MAETTSLAEPSAVPSDEDLKRAEQFTLEPFVHEGEDRASVLAPGTPRRRALDDALAELDAGLKEPSATWRHHYSLMLGLERLLSEDEPKLVDGTVLSAHQVDALSGTLIALLAEAQSANGNSRANGAAPSDVEELPSGEVELEGDEELEDEDEPLDWQDEAPAEEDEGDAGAGRGAGGGGGGRGGRGRGTPRRPQRRPPLLVRACDRRRQVGRRARLRRG